MRISHTTTDLTGISLREATPADAWAVAELAMLDDRPAPSGRILIAIRDGVILAAVGSDGRTVADPFIPTSAIVATLRAWLAALSGPIAA